MKPRRIGAMGRNGPDTIRSLTCAFETRRTSENPWCVAHNPVIAGRSLLALPSSSRNGRPGLLLGGGIWGWRGPVRSLYISGNWPLTQR